MQDSQQEEPKFGADIYPLEQRKTWYSTVAEAYNRVRPRYPQALCDRAIELAGLRAGASILEIGCGPGTATLSFAQRGFSLVSLEPSLEAYQFASLNCAQYPNVEIKNTTFEDWELGERKFDAVLAATSLHWVSPEIRFAKTAAVLRDNGALILLWNATVQPQYDIYQIMHEVYQIHAPSLGKYEDSETQQQSLGKFAQAVVDSGKFENLVAEYLPCKATYSIDDYLMLLSTYSPYIELEAYKRDTLFAELKAALVSNEISSIPASYLSVCQVAKKI
ncbi:class I SAM-dependent methyltransferase [Aliterella atlantica]|uniref:Methyltransferase n=1 Tax=Aliterella atlantica CENA595 TaxID=1618023 RepID=A0A0D8ZSC7_9CYAN|nr:class I SAM-dependent methyltransferase [Aliterella atlantica]KJH71237.1 methyltransferase [Aliterella atlantica CENA595]